MQSLATNTPFGRKFSFQITPESLQPIDVISFSIGILSFAVIDEAMDVSSCSDPGVSFPGGNLWGMNSYLHHAQRLFPLCSLYNFFEFHFGHTIFAIFNSVNPSLIQVVK